jgi:hypothetical protein
MRMLGDIVALHLVYAAIWYFVKHMTGKKGVQDTHAWRLKYMPSSTPKDPRGWEAMSGCCMVGFTFMAAAIYIMSWVKILSGESLFN